MTVKVPPGKITLRSARLALGWTQEELEAKSGVSQPVISRIEQGGQGRATSYDTAYELTRAMGRSLTDIYWPTGLVDWHGGRKTKHYAKAGAEESRPATCPIHFITLPAATSRCDECA